MKRRSYLVVSLVLALSLLLASPASALFLPSDGQAATLVLGQLDFTSSTAQLTQSGLNSPQDVTVDPVSAKVFVADTVNNRVLRFASLAALKSGSAAEAVLGQPDFTSSAARTTQNGLHSPVGLAVDSSGRLWVVDAQNSRVLRFDHAATAANGANADGVLGQPDFVTKAENTTQNGMASPAYATADASGRLWVADWSNTRVLRFDAAASKSNGADADGVLGEPNFTSTDARTTQDGFWAPAGVAVDASGRLWVADFGNNRVLRFDSAASKANGANADAVLGQPDFTSRSVGGGQSGLNDPAGVAVDAGSGLYVADEFSSRVLFFAAAASLPNGGNASYVLGQPDFTTGTPNTGGISSATLNYPTGLFYDPVAQVLLGSDGSNNRVLMYGQPYATLHILPFIGLVRLFLPPGVTPIGSIEIQTADGALHTFDVAPDARILPSKRASQLGDGSFVTVLTRFDESTGNMVVFQIVVHPNGVGPGSAP